MRMKLRVYFKVCVVDAAMQHDYNSDYYIHTHKHDNVSLYGNDVLTIRELSYKYKCT